MLSNTPDPSTVAALQLGQRQGFTLGIVLMVGAKFLFKAARAHTLDTLGFKRVVRYEKD